MRKIYFVFLILTLSIVSCTKNLQADSPSLLPESSFSQSTTLIQANDNSVSIFDVVNVIRHDSLQSKSSDSKYEITPYLSTSADTLMYIVNFDNDHGWKIYSSDKRTPAIIAEGETGHFSLTEGNPAVAIWANCIAEDIAKVRTSTDSELSFSAEEIQVNKTFWSREEPPRQVFPPEIPLGHWEEVVFSQIVEYDHVDHLVAHWDQNAPYNACCPYFVSTPNKRAYAGCVAISGAQMLLYLHNKIGIPECMYSEGYCNGNVNGYEQHFSNSNSTIWSSMSTTYQSSSSTTLPEAILIGYVGSEINMHYCDNITGQYSWALPGNLKTALFGNLGISCSRGSYNETIVKESLLAQMPVICSASNLAIPLDWDIHCFVIDGYRRTRTQYTHHHYYVLDGTPSGQYPMPREYDTYTYSSPQLTSIKINWGWWDQWSETPVNDGWYSLTAGWTVTNGGTYDYNHNVNMTYGFAASE